MSVAPNEGGPAKERMEILIQPRFGDGVTGVTRAKFAEWSDALSGCVRCKLRSLSRRERTTDEDDATDLFLECPVEQIHIARDLLMHLT